MKTIRMTGWRPGLQKVSLTQALQKTGVGLKSAKSCTDSLLGGDMVDVLVDETYAGDLLRWLRKLGVNAELAEDPPKNPTQHSPPR